jgi:hypothetical protein
MSNYHINAPCLFKTIFALSHNRRHARAPELPKISRKPCQLLLTAFNVAVAYPETLRLATVGQVLDQQSMS